MKQTIVVSCFEQGFSNFCHTLHVKRSTEKVKGSHKAPYSVDTDRSYAQLSVKASSSPFNPTLCLPIQTVPQIPPGLLLLLFHYIHMHRLINHHVRFPAKCHLYHNAVGKSVCVVWSSSQCVTGYLNVKEIVQSEVRLCACMFENPCLCGTFPFWLSEACALSC